MKTKIMICIAITIYEKKAGSVEKALDKFIDTYDKN
jgi:hypothetical protein